MAIICALGGFALPGGTARAGEIYNLIWGDPDAPPSMKQIGKMIDGIEDKILDDGTVVIKQPDIWGQARMTRFRKEFETQMQTDLGKFAVVLSARVARSDQASFENQTALGLALQGAPGRGRARAATASASSADSTPVTINVPDPANFLKASTELFKNAPPEHTIDRTAPFALLKERFADLGQKDSKLGVEPTVYLNQEQRYLDHLNEIRRVHLGDDTADSAGYALYLMRMPVSVQPGEKTYRGKGAILTATARHEFTPGFLDTTYRNLVINDLADQLTPIVGQFLRDGTVEKFEELAARNADLSGLEFVIATPLTSSRISSGDLRIAPSDVAAVYNARNLLLIAFQAKESMPTKRVRDTDVHAYLRRELQTAYNLLPHYVGSIERIVGLIETRELEALKGVYLNEFLPLMPGELKGRPTIYLNALCWAVAVDAGLLNRQIHDDMRKRGEGGGFACPEDLDAQLFYLPMPRTGPDPAYLAAEAVFEAYVRARWPVITFAIDPVTDEQNIADAYSMRRDLQLAASFAFATGGATFSQFNRFMRRMELDAETIALNRTVTAFAHGNETFGWRISPRYQTPPQERSNLQTMANLLIRGGPGRNYQIDNSKLEAGQRDLTVVLILPSFLTRVRVETTANWFRLHDPDERMIHTSHMLEQGRRVTELRQAVAQACDTGGYRPGDLAQLTTRVDQIEAMLPMQTYKLNVPYENTLGGFALFSPGATALVPELIGYEGAEKVVSGQTTDLLLYGKHIDIFETKVVAGGALIANETNIDVVSRDVIRVRIPAEVQPTLDHQGQPHVEIHLATPNGISNRLLVPYEPAPPAQAAPARAPAATNPPSHQPAAGAPAIPRAPAHAPADDTADAVPPPGLPDPTPLPPPAARASDLDLRGASYRAEPRPRVIPARLDPPGRLPSGAARGPQARPLAPATANDAAPRSTPAPTRNARPSDRPPWRPVMTRILGRPE